MTIEAVAVSAEALAAYARVPIAFRVARVLDVGADGPGGPRLTERALDAPYERLARTARVIDAITYGPRADADRLTRRVRAMHRRVRGELAEPAGRFPAGTPYAADDPELEEAVDTLRKAVGLEERH